MKFSEKQLKNIKKDLKGSIDWYFDIVMCDNEFELSSFLDQIKNDAATIEHEAENKN